MCVNITILSVIKKLNLLLSNLFVEHRQRLGLLDYQCRQRVNYSLKKLGEASNISMLYLLALSKMKVVTFFVYLFEACNVDLFLKILITSNLE